MLESTHVGTAAAAFMVASAAAWPLRHAALAWGFVDRPAARKHHRSATPMLGGVAIVLGMLIPLLVGAFVLAGSGPSQNATLSWALVIGVLLLMTVGLIDDRVGVGVVGKLAIQLAAAALIVSAGVSGPWHAALGPILGTAIDVLWLVGLTNAFNLLDNVDGLAAAIATVAGVGVLAVHASPHHEVPHLALLATALVGACLGFLVHNWSPARMFMGDAGSLPIGLVVATLGLGLGATLEARFAAFDGGSTVHLVAWLVPLLVVAVPIADTATVSVSRLRRGKNPLTTPGTDHLSHRLLGRGWSVRGAVSVLILVGLMANVVAFLLSFSLTSPAAVAELP